MMYLLIVDGVTVDTGPRFTAFEMPTRQNAHWEIRLVGSFGRISRKISSGIIDQFKPNN